VVQLTLFRQLVLGLTLMCSVPLPAAYVRLQCCEGLNHGVLAVGYGTESDGTPYWCVGMKEGGGAARHGS